MKRKSFASRIARDAPAEPCRHCGERPSAVGRRGMCLLCYQRPGVRLSYPHAGTGRRGVSIGPLAAPPDPVPCPHPPGTPGRVATYERRAAAGFALFSAADARPPESPAEALVARRVPA